MESISRYRIGNQKGFFTLTLLSWLPLLLTLISGMAIVASSLTHLQQAENICLQSHLRLQKNLRENLKALLALNPKATALRKQREVAEANLKLALASGQPPWIAQATAQKSFVVAAQLALRTQQLLLMAEARRQRMQTTVDLKQKLHGIVDSTQTSLMALQKSLAVRPEPPASLSPNYSTSSNFSEEQSQSATLQISFPQRMPKWISQKSFQKTFVCGASLKNDQPQWSLALLKDKFWWNWRSSSF